jgi:hypothetical protein
LDVPNGILSSKWKCNGSKASFVSDHSEQEIYYNIMAESKNCRRGK